MKNYSENISRQEQAIKRFLRNNLGKPQDGEAVHHILAELGGYYDADRSYIFELNAERTHASNTYEWCREGVSSEMPSRHHSQVLLAWVRSAFSSKI